MFGLSILVKCLLMLLSHLLLSAINELDFDEYNIMGQWRRVIHNGPRIVSVEHRADEFQLGSPAYNDENLPAEHVGLRWFLADVVIFNDAEGLVPWEALSVNNGTVVIDATIRDTQRQGIQDRTRGAGGEIDTLIGKLADNTITDAELRDMWRLERGL